MTCKRCGVTKPEEGFYTQKSNKCGRKLVCKICDSRAKAAAYPANRERIQATNERWRLRNLEKIRASALLTAKRYRKGRRDYLWDTFRMSEDDYNAMLMAQNYVCAICGDINAGDRMLQVDHDHACCPGKKTCGKCIRGLLCSKCNLMLGAARDDLRRLAQGSDYVRRYRLSAKGKRMFTTPASIIESSENITSLKEA